MYFFSYVDSYKIVRVCRSSILYKIVRVCKNSDLMFTLKTVAMAYGYLKDERVSLKYILKTAMRCFLQVLDNTLGEDPFFFDAHLKTEMQCL